MAITILIIDDDPDFIASTSEILEAQEYQVISSPSGIEGFEKAKQIKPNLILLDVMMEDAGTGLDIAKKLRDDQDTADIPVLIMTGIRRADQLLSSYAPGEEWPNVKNALEKPVAPELLFKTLQKAIR